MAGNNGFVETIACRQRGAWSAFGDTRLGVVSPKTTFLSTVVLRVIPGVMRDDEGGGGGAAMPQPALRLVLARDGGGDGGGGGGGGMMKFVRRRGLDVIDLRKLSTKPRPLAAIR